MTDSTYQYFPDCVTTLTMRDDRPHGRHPVLTRGRHENLDQHFTFCEHEQCNLHHYAHECFWTNPNLIASPNLRRKWKRKILRHEIGMCPREARDRLPEELMELLTVLPDDSDFDPQDSDDDDGCSEYGEEDGEEDGEDYYDSQDDEDNDGEEGQDEDNGDESDFGEEGDDEPDNDVDPYGNPLSLPGEGIFI